MATFSKPTVVPNWATTSGNIAVPSAGKRNDGWLSAEEPASDIENWNKRTTGEWLEWIDERFFDGATNDDIVIRSPATIGNSATDGINLEGVGNVKDIEFDGTLNRMSYDVSTDIWSLFVNSGTAAMTVSETLATLNKPLTVAGERVIAEDYFITGSRSKMIGPSNWTSDGAANLQTGGGIFENTVNTDVSEASIDLDTLDQLTGVSVFASQSTAGTLTLSLHSISDAGVVSAAIATDTNTGTGALVNLVLGSLTETFVSTLTYMLRVVSSGSGVVKVGNTRVAYDRPAP